MRTEISSGVILTRGISPDPHLRLRGISLLAYSTVTKYRSTFLSLRTVPNTLAKMNPAISNLVISLGGMQGESSLPNI